MNRKDIVSMAFAIVTVGAVIFLSKFLAGAVPFNLRSAMFYVAVVAILFVFDRFLGLLEKIVKHSVQYLMRLFR